MLDLLKYNFKRIVIVAYRLPFKLMRKDGKIHAIQNSGGLVSAILSLSQKIPVDLKQADTKKTVWVGKGENDLADFANQEIVNDYFDIKPVTISDSINDKFYGGFCNDLIWPLFHYFPSLTVFDTSYYDNYVKANELFFEELKNEIQPGDFIWIHDYQLFLLPSLIRTNFPNASVAFFLHIPFPSYEVFRILPTLWRNNILKGILGADLVGFHTNDYAQYFTKSVRRCLGYDTSMQNIYSEGRIVRADSFPIGIDYNKFSDAALTAETGKYITKLIKQKGNQKLIFSVDRLDYTKGILQRLSAFELFLEKHRFWRGKVIFNMVVVPSRDSIARYQTMKKEIESTVGSINAKYSTLEWRPVFYQYKSLKFHEMIALYNLSDVALITPLRDGMNLVAKEFIACRHQIPGMLILSEMAGAAAELGEAMLVNPTDKNEVADAIEKALLINEEEALLRIRKMQQRLMEYDVFSWAADIVSNTMKVKQEQSLFTVKFINNKIEKEIVEAFRKAKNRVLFFDYDGTLVPIQKYPELAVPENKTLEITGILAQTTDVVIISGREKSFLERWFNNQSVYMVAEHGAYIRLPGTDWTIESNHDTIWKETIYPILLRYVNRCTGTFIEEKNASLCWHYRNADVDFAAIRALELREELTEVISGHLPLQIIDGHKVIEIKKAGYNKGTAASSILSLKKFDFILAIGDDKTDEELFAALPSYAYSIKVGKDPTAAKYNFQKQSDVLNFLECLLNC